MTKREKIKQKIDKNLSKIGALRFENLDLLRESYLLSDKEQWYTEKEEEFVISKRPKVVEKKMVGRINWNEYFRDESNPDDESAGVWIKRSQPVKIDGKWIHD